MGKLGLWILAFAMVLAVFSSSVEGSEGGHASDGGAPPAPEDVAAAAASKQKKPGNQGRSFASSSEEDRSSRVNDRRFAELERKVQYLQMQIENLKDQVTYGHVNNNNAALSLALQPTEKKSLLDKLLL